MAQERQSRPWERHVQTLLMTVCVALLGTVAKVGSDMSAAMAVQSETIRGVNESIGDLRVQVDRLNARFSDYLTRSEAEVRFRAGERRDDDHSRRIERLEIPARGGGG